MLTTFLMDIKDFRRPQAQKYKLHDVILFSILAILCNAKSYRDIHRFMKIHFEDLKRDFSLSWKKAPAYTSIRNIIKGVDGLELEAAFTYIAKAASGHGRIVNRTTQVYQQKISDFILDDYWATQLKTLVCVSRTYDVFNTKTKAYEQSSEKAWYVSNVKLTAEKAAGYILNHWGIENTNHYVRDVSLAEDAARIRKNSGNMAILRSAAMNTMRHQKVANIKGELYQNSLKWKQLYTYQHFI